MRIVPKAVFGYIGGSGTWGARFPEDFSREEDVKLVDVVNEVPTPYGVGAGFKILEICGKKVIRFAMHGAYPEGRNHIPIEKAAKQVAWVMKEAGVTHAISEGSVGGVQAPDGTPLPPWSMLVPDDFIIGWKGESVVATSKLAGKVDFYRLAEPFCTPMRSALYNAALRHSRGEVYPKGVYACTPLGRFETKTEVQNLKRNQANVVGQTIAFEAVEARAQGIHFACINIVSNYAEGSKGTEWVGTAPEAMQKFYFECPAVVGNIMIDAMIDLLAHEIMACNCLRYKLTGLNKFPVKGA